MPERTAITLLVPLPCAWTDEDDPGARAVVKVERPGSAPFASLPIGTTLRDDMSPDDRANQDRLEKATDATVTVAFLRTPLGGGDPESRQATVGNVTLEPFTLGRSKRSQGSDEDFDVLLQGSIVIPVDDAFRTDFPSFTDWLKDLWPTGDATHVTSLRAEPDGLYLQGKLPGALFADRSEQEVALRVPQVAKRDVNEPVPHDPRHQGRFWTFTSFRFRELETDSRQFVTAHTVLFREFALRGARPDPTAPRRSDSFIDNITTLKAGPDCVVRIFRQSLDETQALEWEARDPGVRIMIAAGRSDETAFFPRALTGRAEFKDSVWKRAAERPVQFESGRFDSKRELKPIRLGLRNPPSNAAGMVNLDFPSHELVALSVPIVPAAAPVDPAGLPPSPEREADVGPDAKREPVLNWICTRDGWLSLAAEQPVSDPGPGQPERDVSGVIPIDTLAGALLRAIGEQPSGAEAVAGLEIRTEALAAGHIALALAREADGSEIISLSLTGPRTTVLTPRVWFAPNARNRDADPQQNSVPSLTAASLPEAQQTSALDLEGEVDEARKRRADELDKRLESVLHPATFVTPDPKDLDKLDAENAHRLHARILWDRKEKRFRFMFKADRLSVWQRPHLPVVTNHPLSPPSDRDAYLDSNRGLLPFKRSGESGAEEVAVAFPANALPYLVAESDVAPPVFPRPASVDNWDPILPARVFLPTLPGLETDITRMETTWDYRHAVPALDEAYAEVREAEDTPEMTPKAPGLDLTRIAGAVAFTVDSANPKATGWLPPGHEVELHNVATTGLATANPSLSFRIHEAHAELVTFDRTSGVAELSADVSADFDANATPPSFTNLKLEARTAAETGPEAIVHNGQPMLTRWNDQLHAMVTLDGDGLIRSEPTASDIRSWATNNEGTVIETVRRTRSLLLKAGDDVHTLDLFGVSVGADPQDPTLERWCWRQSNSKSWPLLLGFPLYPLNLKTVEPDGGVTLEAIWLPRPPAKGDDPLHAPEYASESVILSFEPTDIPETLALKSLSGRIDWRFPAEPDAPEEEPVAERLLAEVELDAGRQSVTLKTEEIAIRHPIGLLRLAPASNSARRAGSIAAVPGEGIVLRAIADDRIVRGQSELDYDATVELHPSSAEDSKPVLRLTEYEFKWADVLKDGAKWEIKHGNPAPTADLDADVAPTPWQFRLCRKSQALAGILGVVPHRLSARDVLFQVTSILRSPNLPDKSWFRARAKASGFAAVTFTPGDQHSTVPLPARFSAEIPISLGAWAADRTLQIYDPESLTLSTLDRNTESVLLDSQRNPVHNPPLSNATVGGFKETEVVFARPGELGSLFAMVRDKNIVRTRKFYEGASVSALVILRMVEEHRLLTADHTGAVRAWDLNKEASPKPQEGSGRIVDGVLGLAPPVGSKLSALAAPPGTTQEVVAWARIAADGESDAGVAVWDFNRNPFADDTDPANTKILLRRANPHVADLSPGMTPPGSPTPAASAITSLSMTSEGHIVSGAKDGTVLVWNRNTALTEVPVVYQRMKHGDKTITAVAVLVAGDDRIVSADHDGEIKVWPRPETGTVTALPDPIPEPEALHVISHGAGVSAIVPLDFDNTTQRTRIAVLDRDGTVTIYAILLSSAFRGDKTIFTREVLDTRGATVRAIGPLRDEDGSVRLVLDGVARPSHLEGVIRVAQGETDEPLPKIELELSGRIACQDAITFVDGVDGTRRCTHRVELLIDRAPLPLESVYFGRGPATPQVIGAIAEHTLRFPDGTDRNWQTPQVVRLMTASQFRSTYSGDDPGDEHKDALVIDAGAIHWLNWCASAVSTPGGAAHVTNDAMHISLRAREIQRFERGQPRSVRLPTVLRRHPDTPPLNLSLKVGEDEATALHFPSSGALPPQPPPQPLTIELADAPSLDTAEPEHRISYFERTPEALWLAEPFLRGTLTPNQDPPPHDPLETSDPSQPNGPVSPFVMGELGWQHQEKTLDDLGWLRKTDLPEYLAKQLPQGIDLQSVGPIRRRRQQPLLAAATVANKHRPDGPPQPTDARIDGPTLAEFPYVVALESRTSGNSEGKSNGDGEPPLFEPAVFHDAQLVAFEQGHFRRLARVQLQTEDEATDEELLAIARKWARDLLDARGRADAAFLLLDARHVVPLERPFGSIREDLRGAWSWEAGSGDNSQSVPESRCIPPGAEGSGLRADPSLALVLFGARPVGPHPANQPVKGVAATRFHLAPTKADGNAGAGRLRPAEVNDSWNFDFTTLDDVEFTACVAEPEGSHVYPRRDPGAIARRPIPQRALETDIQSVLPPLVDIVAWAARPGEMMRSLWSLQRHGDASGPSTGTSLRRPRAKPGSGESVRIQPLSKPILAGGGRFCEQAFRLTQVMDLTRFEDNETVYAVLTTKSELFRSSASRKSAATNPGRIYKQEPFELTVIAVEDGFPKAQTGELPDGTTVVISATKLVFVNSGEELESVPESRQIPLEPPTSPPVEGWEELFSEPKSVFSNRIDLPSGLEDSFDVFLVTYKRDLPPPPDPIPPLKPDPSDVHACLSARRLDPEGRFRSPKLSVSLLARRKEADPLDGPYHLAGYGRLSDSDFTPIRPGGGKIPIATPDERPVEWSRMAGLRSLDRVDAAGDAKDPFRYDVVVYGPGGEQLP